MSVSRAQREIDSAEFAEWMAYAMLEPFGPEREDQRAGVVAALIANVNRDPRRRSEPYDVEDFFPRYDPHAEGPAGATPDGPSPEALEAKLFAWAATMNAANDARGKRVKSELRPKG